MKIENQLKKKNALASKVEIARILKLLSQDKNDRYAEYAKKDVQVLLKVLRRYVLNVGGDLPWPPTVESWAPTEQVAHKSLYYSFAATEGLEDVADGLVPEPESMQPTARRPRRG